MPILRRPFSSSKPNDRDRDGGGGGRSIKVGVKNSEQNSGDKKSGHSVQRSDTFTIKCPPVIEDQEYYDDGYSVEHHQQDNTNNFNTFTRKKGMSSF